MGFVDRVETVVIFFNKCINRAGELGLERSEYGNIKRLEEMGGISWKTHEIDNGIDCCIEDGWCIMGTPPIHNEHQWAWEVLRNRGSKKADPLYDMNRLVLMNPDSDSATAGPGTLQPSINPKRTALPGRLNTHGTTKTPALPQATIGKWKLTIGSVVQTHEEPPIAITVALCALLKSRFVNVENLTG